MTPMNDGPHGRLFVVSAPSGAGKSTLCDMLRERFPRLCYSVSHTTRQPRGGERDGVEYHFISKEAFQRGIEEREWAEWAEVHGNYYGTSARLLDHLMAQGYGVLLDIDVQGAAQIVKCYPDAVTIFIMPPDMNALAERLNRRGTDSSESITRRMEDAKAEIARRGEYRHVIINDDLQEATRTMTALVAGYLEAP